LVGITKSRPHFPIFGAVCCVARHHFMAVLDANDFEAP
jgi:hypothetical protein